MNIQYRFNGFNGIEKSLRLRLDGVSSGGPLAHLHLLFSGFDVLLRFGESASFGAGKLFAQIQRLRLFVFIEFA